MSSLRSVSRRERKENRSRCGKRIRPRYVPELSRVECIRFIAAIMVVLLGNVDSSSFILCKKKGVFRRSLLWVKGSGKFVVGYAISFLCHGRFLVFFFQ